MGGRTYDDAGVSIEKGADIVERLRAAAESTGAAGFGAFAGLHPLDDTRLLAASTDSVGTKLVLARQRGALRNCGADLAAHCINDVITCGADPLVLLDYVAANTIDPAQVVELVEGAAEVCRTAGVALIGGETAELPGIYQEGKLDFAGTCVGVVDRARVIDGSQVVAGDVVVGLPSAGVHANGFTLVRRVLRDEDYDGKDLLAPTRLYLDDVRRLRDRAHAFAHVTGGGSSETSSASCRPGSAPRSTGTPGSARPSSTGSRVMWRRTSCAACSTSASGSSRCSPRPATKRPWSEESWPREQCGFIHTAPGGTGHLRALRIAMFPRRCPKRLPPVPGTEMCQFCADVSTGVAAPGAGRQS